MLWVSRTIPLINLPIWKRALRIWAISASNRWLWSHCSSSKSVRILVLTDGPATSSSDSGSVSRAFPFPFPTLILLDGPASALAGSTAQEILPLAKITCAHLFVVLPPNAGPIEPTARVANPPILGSPRTPVRRRQGPEYGKTGPGALPFLRFDMRTRSRIRRILSLLHLPSLRPLLGGLGSLFEPPPLLLCQVLAPGQRP